MPPGVVGCPVVRRCRRIGGNVEGDGKKFDSGDTSRNEEGVEIQKRVRRVACDGRLCSTPSEDDGSIGKKGDCAGDVSTEICCDGTASAPNISIREVAQSHPERGVASN
jgi:hypothetical protein